MNMMRTISYTQTQKILIGALAIIFVVTLSILVITKRDVFTDSSKDGDQGSNLPTVTEKSMEELAASNKINHKEGYQFTIPKGWNLVNIEEDQAIPLDESKALAVVKPPNSEAYPLNYSANIAIYVYNKTDDLFENGGFDLESVNDFLIQKDILIDDDEEITEQLDVDFRKGKLGGVAGNEYLFNAETNQSNIFAENNYLAKVGNKIYAVSFHDLGKEKVVEQSRKVFEEFLKSFKIIQK
jgi:hypothetical protein